MSWRLEASGATGANRITIEPVKEEHVRIRVVATNGEHPTMQILPRGTIYRSRNGVEYTILNAIVEEVGPEDGETSFWVHNYLALIGAHTLMGLHP